VPLNPAAPGACRGFPDAAVGDGDVPLQHALGAGAEAQIDIADDPATQRVGPYLPEALFADSSP
jgi:hypothetical protein